MKKLVGLILGLVMVLALAGAANAAAAPEISGKFLISGTWIIGTDWDWGFVNESSVASVTFSKTFGPATAGLTLDGLFAAPSMASASYDYKFSDSFSLGAFYSRDNSVAYAGPIFGDLFIWNGAVIKGVFKFDGGSISILSDAQDPLYFIGSGSYSDGPLTIGGGFLYAGGFAAGGSVAYKVTDQLTLTGEVLYLGITAFGAKAAYAGDVVSGNAVFKYALGNMSLDLDASAKVVPDLLTLSGALGYDIDAGVVTSYKGQVDVKISAAVSAYGVYASGDGFDCGVNFVIDGTNSLKTNFDVDEETFTASLEIAF